MNKGLKLELDFVNYFNGRRFGDLSKKWKKHFLRMFPAIKKNDVITSYKYKDKYAKPDIAIEVKDKRILLSIKTGSNPTMHYEKFTSFYAFLKGMGIPFDILNIIVFYHFGESKRYGHKDKPLSKEELVKNYGYLIKRANDYLNQEHIIKAVYKRAITEGAIMTRERIDYFYYGVLEKGFLVNRKQIRLSVTSRTNSHSDFIHFGELVYQPAARSRDNDDFLCTTIHWPILARLFYEIEDEDDFLKGRKTKE